jgi:hypothetical protein
VKILFVEMLPYPVKYSSFSLFNLWLKRSVRLGKSERKNKGKTERKGEEMS